MKRNKLAENCSGLTESDKKDYEECDISFMDIDVTPVVAQTKQIIQLWRLQEALF